MTQALAAQHQPTEVALIDPADLKAWELANRVFTWMTENACYNYTEAFRQLGVARSSFYRAIKRPFVQGKLLARLEAVDHAVAKMLEDHWTPVVANMVRIAQGETREAVQAARFLAQEKEKLQQQGNGREQEGPSVARTLLEQFKTARKVAARRSFVTEEVELSPGEGEAGVVIEG